MSWRGEVGSGTRERSRVSSTLERPSGTQKCGWPKGWQFKLLTRKKPPLEGKRFSSLGREVNDKSISLQHGCQRRPPAAARSKLSSCSISASRSCTSPLSWSMPLASSGPSACTCMVRCAAADLRACHAAAGWSGCPAGRDARLGRGGSGARLSPYPEPLAAAAAAPAMRAATIAAVAAASLMPEALTGGANGWEVLAEGLSDPTDAIQWPPPAATAV